MLWRSFSAKAPPEIERMRTDRRNYFTHRCSRYLILPKEGLVSCGCRHPVVVCFIFPDFGRHSKPNNVLPKNAWGYQVSNVDNTTTPVIEQGATTDRAIPPTVAVSAVDNPQAGLVFLRLPPSRMEAFFICSVFVGAFNLMGLRDQHLRYHNTPVYRARGEDRRDYSIHSGSRCRRQPSSSSGILGLSGHSW